MLILSLELIENELILEGDSDSFGVSSNARINNLKWELYIYSFNVREWMCFSVEYIA